MPSLRLMATSLAALVVLVPARAAAVASFSPAGPAANLRFVNNGAGAPDVASGGNGGRLYATATGTAQSPGFASVSFSFLSGPLAALGPVAAWFQLDASTTLPAVVDNGSITQGGLNGSLRFTSRTPLTVGTLTRPAGTELLRADFTGARLLGTGGGSTANLVAGDGGTINLTSAFIDFGNARNKGFSIGLAGLLSPLQTAGSGSAVNSFRAAASGLVSADAGVTISAVPEPQSWALLIAGFIMIGMQQRRRQGAIRTAG